MKPWSGASEREGQRRRRELEMDSACLSHSRPRASALSRPSLTICRHARGETENSRSPLPPDLNTSPGQLLFCSSAVALIKTRSLCALCVCMCARHLWRGPSRLYWLRDDWSSARSICTNCARYCNGDAYRRRIYTCRWIILARHANASVETGGRCAFSIARDVARRHLAICAIRGRSFEWRTGEESFFTRGRDAKYRNVWIFRLFRSWIYARD